MRVKSVSRRKVPLPRGKEIHVSGEGSDVSFRLFSNTPGVSKNVRLDKQGVLSRDREVMDVVNVHVVIVLANLQALGSPDS